MTDEERKLRKREAYRAWAAKNRERLRESKRAWNAKNMHKIVERTRKWRAADPERARELDRRCRANNPEPGRKAGRKYRAANPHKTLAKSRAWSAANPDAVRAMKLRRRACGRVTATDVTAIKSTADGVCAYCLQRKPLHVDHVLPVSRGGSNALDNLVMACKSCNSKKSAKTPLEYFCGLPALGSRRQQQPRK